MPPASPGARGARDQHPRVDDASPYDGTEPARFASLPWYDLPEIRPYTDALWGAIATELRAAGCRDVPAALDRERPSADDNGPACLFTQTCGYPLLTTARDRFAVLGIPCYGVAGCAGPLHCSFIVVRDGAPIVALEDLRGTIFAINELHSNTGMNLPRRSIAPLAAGERFFARTVLSGSHAASAALVAAGEADAAALDCVTFALLARYRPAAVASLRAIARTPFAPAPPLVTSRTTAPAVVHALRAALRDVAAKPEYAELRAALFLDGISTGDDTTYEIILTYEREAGQLGYPELC